MTGLVDVEALPQRFAQHQIINIVSQVPPNTDFTVPPTARAAALRDATVPVAVNISSGASSPAQT